MKQISAADIEITLGLPTNSLSITDFGNGTYEFEPPLTSEQSAIATKLYRDGVPHAWVATPLSAQEKWLEFYSQLIVSAPYHHIRELAKTNIQVNLFYTDLAGNLTAAIAGMPNPTGFQATYNDLKAALASIDTELTQEELDTLQTLGSSCNIPINW